MMWPILTKGTPDLLYIGFSGPCLPIWVGGTVQYERLPALFRTVHIWRQVVLSLILNWIIGPFVSHYLHPPCDPLADHVTSMHITGHARHSLGHAPRPPDLPNRCHHGRPRPVHRHGDDLEPTRPRGYRLLRRIGHHQLSTPDRALLAHELVVHQRHIGGEELGIGLQPYGHRGLYLPGDPVGRGGRDEVLGDMGDGQVEVRERLFALLWTARFARSALYVSVWWTGGLCGRSGR